MSPSRPEPAANTPKGAKHESGSAGDEKSAAKLSEAEFLKRQADDAKAAISHSLSELKAKLAQGADPLEWARQYPWISLGVAAVAGFVGTTLVVPSREQQAIARLAAIERAVNAKADAHSVHHETPKGDKESLVKMIVKEAFAVVRPAVVSLITAGLASRNKPEDDQSASEAGSGSEHG